jgi:hypothetical protein
MRTGESSLVLGMCSACARHVLCHLCREDKKLEIFTSRSAGACRLGGAAELHCAVVPLSFMVPGILFSTGAGLARLATSTCSAHRFGGDICAFSSPTNRSIHRSYMTPPPTPRLSSLVPLVPRVSGKFPDLSVG